MALDTAKTNQYVGDKWDNSILPTLQDYIRIPNQSPSFDPTNEHLADAVNLLFDWVEKQKVPGAKAEISCIENRTPIILIDVPATKPTNAKTVLLYGHCDKQPPLTEKWAPGLHPYTPVIRDGKLYGRGGADDGYAVFAAIASIQVLKEQNIPHDRYVIIIEASEESGSPDLPYYIEHHKNEIGVPSLIVCLDSGCGNYDQFWMTSSLRGMLVGDLRVDILNDGVHSGHASGIVASSFRIARMLLERIEKLSDGSIVEDFHVRIPPAREEQAKYQAEVLGKEIYEEFPYVEGAQPVSHDLGHILLNRAWRPALSVTGADGFPTLQQAGNVLRPYTTLKLSLRIPPTLDAQTAGPRLKEILEKDPPYGAKVTFKLEKQGSGWESPALKPWLEEAVKEASVTFFNKPHVYAGEGGSIPFMGMLGKRFPEAQFVITGLLGPGSNAHGPNEFLHIQYAKKLTGAVASILAAQAKQN
eukprot:Phypoly_transcript_07229.p1 GENE.Phypoly_transcript_07229~~Phypoly_transcript_07229.p1  ORF type:complete len:472 (+),score=90.32 Phypoly_transcript_07229:14-1429(+)